MSLGLRLLRLADLRAAGKHIERHAFESGRGGDPVFAPFTELDRDAYEETRQDTWRRPTDVPGWERCFGAFDGDRIVGHVDLTGPGLYSALHRARLGIGVERDQRGRGTGGALLSLALSWARTELNLVWIDLSVFGHNTRARSLYERHGFVQIGRTEDAYRLGALHIDDIHMSLRLKD
ncbi:MAG TPA: GNAT family N-acetyltransferase [Polyangiales bacterium]